MTSLSTFAHFHHFDLSFSLTLYRSVTCPFISSSPARTTRSLKNTWKKSPFHHFVHSNPYNSGPQLIRSLARMKTLVAASLLLPLAVAHTRFTTLFVNSKSQGDGTCIRMDMDGSTTTNWIHGLSSAEMACGVQGDTPVNRTCPLKAGDSISLLHRSWTDGSRPGSIDPGHKGPTAVYMKKLADAGSSDPYSTKASGDGWFKIAWDGYDEASQQWGTEKMIANDGLISTTVPSDLSAGYYLVRSDILALHSIVNDNVEPQFYVGCAQIYVDGTGSGDSNAQTVSIPGYIDDQPPALNYNIYQNSPLEVPYQEFGPPVYGAGSDGSSNSAGSKRAYVAKRWDRRVNGKPGQGPTFGTRSWWNWYTSVRPTDEPVLDTSDDLPVNTHNNVANTGTGSVDTGYSTKNPTTTTTDAGVAESTVSKTQTQTATTTTSPSSSSSSSYSSPSSSSSSSSSSPTPSIIGTCPPATVLEVGNQCLTELTSWSDDTPGSLPKCWAASKACWDASSRCWENVSPAVNPNAGCRLWGDKCNALDDWCHGGNLEGPPDEGKILGGAERKLTRRSWGVRARRVSGGI